MKHLRVLYITIILLFLSLIFIAASDDYYFKITKSFDLFGAVFKEISLNYVIEIDPEELANDAIRGLLGSLDPYTVYLDEDEEEDIDLLSTGSYTGLGISVSIRDSMLTITRIQDGFSAQRVGLRIGDRIYKVNNQEILHQSTDALRNFTKGEPGTKLYMQVLRDGINDTLSFTISTEEIKVNNVSYFGMVNNNIGYIALDRFSQLSTTEVKSSIQELKRKNKLDGIILDLRGNPGGLLQAAVEICEIFVEYNSPILSTIGRNKSDVKKYSSSVKPMEPDLKLAVLIDNNSASASEIVAGAIQDLDRGIIVGQQSYGKGLVQSFCDLPYNKSMKMTTSKYYTPSGRCIHRLIYDPDRRNNPSEEIHKDSIFYTKNGREVVESKGIIPDTLVKSLNFSFFITELYFKGYFFDFASLYSSKYSKLPENFQVDNKIIEQFKEFLKKKNYIYQSDIDLDLEKLETDFASKTFSKKTKQQLSNMIKKIKSEQKDPFNEYNDDLKNELYYEICRRFYTEKQMIEKNLTKDDYVTTTVNLLNSNEYKRILKIEYNSYKNFKK